ncbi:MAG: 5-guanidino-2-oxopentanoate decarboxylase [Gammaproteobacteria bacterium]|nr:5-guanidino-2-oxopentanoate decarboxylase [Gammaproteobacteria bacterium]
MTKKTCGEALMHLLEDYGVTTVFGIPGEHTLELYRGIEGSKVRHVTPRNEQGAGFMADGYARASGCPGVCTIISGPGVTNAATPIAQAYADSIPMLIISSANDSPSLGKGWGRLHETTDLCAITAPITAFSAMVHDPSEVPELIAQAFSVFGSRRPRPVHIAIPIDVMEMPANDDWNVSSIPERPVPGQAAINAAADLLENASRPILVVGGGAQQGGDSVTKIAELLNAGVISSNAGKGVVSDNNPLSLTGGVICPSVQQYLGTADVVLAIGTELAEADSFIYDLPVNGKVIRIDIDPARFNDRYPATVGVMGDAGPASDMLLAELQSRGINGAGRNTLEEITQVRSRQSAEFTAVENQHIKLLNLIRDILPDDAIMMGDIAQLVYTGTQVMPTYQPRTWFYPAGYGTLGCALPDAIGAKIALPERTIAALVGDGGFMFTVQELETAVEEELTIPIILWNNDSYAMIRDGMVKRNIPEIGVNPRNPDFIKLADAFGCPGILADSANTFESALRNAMEYKGPTIIMVMENDPWLTA